ncbi:unnamed protein product, partial [Rotaria magnacalcarata]
NKGFTFRYLKTLFLMSLKIIQDSNNVEEFIPINNSVDFDACNACHRSENNDPMKLMEFSSRITALTAEETNLKSLHRRLEMRIKRFLHRTHNSIVIQE